MKTLVLVVDIDDDLGKKAKIMGPVVGEEENKKAAFQLSLADPEDPDANVIMKALQIYYRLKNEGKNVEIATLTGSEELGHRAQMKVARQLDNLLVEKEISSVILVTDGSSDDEVLPIIKSRVKIDAVEHLYMKQAKELEKTYFLILEKLKDPYYAKILIGGPAILLLLFSIMYIFNIRWQFLGLFLGTYLLVKGFGLDEIVKNFLRFLQVSKNPKINFIISVVTVFLFAIATVVAYYTYVNSTLSPPENLFLGIDVFTTVFGFYLLLLMALKGVTLLGKNIVKQLVFLKYFILGVFVFVISKVIFMWLSNAYEPYISFIDAIRYIGVAGIIYLIADSWLENIKLGEIKNMRLIGKEVYDEDHILLGRVIGVDTARGRLKLRTPYETISFVPIQNIEDIDEAILIYR